MAIVAGVVPCSALWRQPLRRSAHEDRAIRWSCAASDKAPSTSRSTDPRLGPRNSAFAFIEGFYKPPSPPFDLGLPEPADYQDQGAARTPAGPLAETERSHPPNLSVRRTGPLQDPQHRDRGPPPRRPVRKRGSDRVPRVHSQRGRVPSPNQLPSVSSHGGCPRGPGPADVPHPARGARHYLKRRKVKQSQKVLGRLEDIARSSIDPAVGDQMRSIIAAQRERLNELRRQMQAERIRADALRSLKPTNAKCDKCGRFRRRKKDTKRTVCLISGRPGKAAKSVRAVSGGLPTLGKGHK